MLRPDLIGSCPMQTALNWKPKTQQWYEYYVLFSKQSIWIIYVRLYNRSISYVCGCIKKYGSANVNKKWKNLCMQCLSIENYLKIWNYLTYHWVGKLISCRLLEQGLQRFGQLVEHTTKVARQTIPTAQEKWTGWTSHEYPGSILVIGGYSIHPKNNLIIGWMRKS